jgi:hypothetical protein
MPQAPQSQPHQDEAEVARIAREAVAIAFGTPATAAQPRAQPKPAIRPETPVEDEAAALAKQAVAIWRGTAA